MSRTNNLEHDGGVLGRLQDYVKHEPARTIEHARSLLLALASWGIISIDDVRTQGVIAVVTIVVSIIAQNKGVRDVVTPYWKVEEGVLTAGVEASIEDYSDELPLPEDE